MCLLHIFMFCFHLILLTHCVINKLYMVFFDPTDLYAYIAAEIHEYKYIPLV